MIFIDTGAFLARYLTRDQHHREAKKSWKALARRSWKCYTSNFVLDETFTLLGRRSSYSFAVARARALYGSATLVILRPSRDDELRAIASFEKFSDQEVSFTDCVSFSLMKQKGIQRAFAFDRHFEDVGFELWRA